MRFNNWIISRVLLEENRFSCHLLTGCVDFRRESFRRRLNAGGVRERPSPLWRLFLTEKRKKREDRKRQTQLKAQAAKKN
jgi:hypothetical protein